MHEVEVGGRRFQLYEPKGRAAIELDRRVLALYARLEPSELTPAGFSRAFTLAAGGMADDEFGRLVELSLPGAVLLGEGDGGRNEGLTADNVWGFFAGRVDELYGLLLAAWEAYGLTPFAKARSGSSTAPTP